MNLFEKYKQKVSQHPHANREIPLTIQTEPGTVVLGDGCSGDNLTCDYSVFKETQTRRWVECLCPGAIKLVCPLQEGDWWEAYLKRKEVTKERPGVVGAPGSRKNIV